MQLIYVGFMLLTIIHLTGGTCVLESEFGFILNCNFKKSGLFRVRNLGGLKAHFGLGFSLGDELGFGESLGNLEGNRRRALNSKTGFINKVGVVSENMISSTISTPYFNPIQNMSRNGTSMTEAMFLPLGVPTFKPIPKVDNNLIRRSGVMLPPDSNNRMSNFQHFSDNVKKQANFSNRQSDIESSTIIGQSTYSGLRNVSKSIPNGISGVISHEMYNKNQTYKVKGMDREKLVQSAKTQSSNYINTLTKKSSKSTSIQTARGIVVMNAPKEYYPSGYDKNFDDNFKSKVELPRTDFACAEQKYFPGLYANINLGCMVFHVCAITDGGIIMKSFLCPESTLFDQSILKCNWWFYVDCANSTYDSNIPISKSYQLMKSLSYFSNFTKFQNIEIESNQKNVINRE